MADHDDDNEYHIFATLVAITNAYNFDHINNVYITDELMLSCLSINIRTRIVGGQ